MQSEAIYIQMAHSIMEYMDEGLIATDKKGSVIYINPMACKFIGLNRKSSMGRPLINILHLLDRNKRTAIRVPSVSTFSRNAKPRNHLYAVLRSDAGKEIIVDSTLTPLISSKGSIEGYFLIIRDMSEKIRTYLQTFDQHKVEAIGSVAQSIALDFSNWLTVISGYASAISDNLLPNTRAHNESLKILQTVEHAGQLPKRLLSIARASDINGQMKIEPVSLGNTIDNAINMVKGSFDEKKITIKVSGKDKTPYAMADSGQLLDCLLNILFNSADAMPKGGKISIDISTNEDGKKTYCVLRIRDTGCGMTKEMMTHIFEPFFTTKEHGTAAGLGLTVVKSSLIRWGGYLKVTSKPGLGTSIRLFIPKAKIQADQKTDIISSPKNKPILIVDDKTKFLTETENILREAGYQVHAASSGEQSVSYYKKYSDEIGLCIIDLVMPGMDGKSVIENILEIDPTTLIILTSGFSRDYARSYLERGSWEFIQKPFRRDHLLEMVHRMLTQKYSPTLQQH